MSAKKKSIKNEYAPLFRILYWSTIGFFFAAIVWTVFDGFMSAANGIQKHNRVTQEYRQAAERKQGIQPSSSSSQRPSSEKQTEKEDGIDEGTIDESTKNEDTNEAGTGKPQESDKNSNASTVDEPELN